MRPRGPACHVFGDSPEHPPAPWRHSSGQNRRTTAMDKKAPAVMIMGKLGLEPDAWQKEVLETKHKRILLNCCRQAGKTTVAAILALSETYWVPGSKTIIVSPSLRQSTELFRVIVAYYQRLGELAKERL